MGHGTLDKAARRTPGRAVSFHIDWYGPGGHDTPARCAVTLDGIVESKFCWLLSAATAHGLDGTPGGEWAL